jgi:hypothetical protein
MTNVTGINYDGFKNRIINGAMVIDQRNAGASVTNGVGFLFITDRWANVGSVASKFTSQQNAGAVTPPTGYINYLGNTSSAATSIGASDYYFIAHKIEGLNIADLAWGTASAATVTLSFWVRSSLTGTFGGSFRNSAQNRSYPYSYTISVANTWEQKTIVIAGDTSGTWVTTNGTGIDISFSLGVGSTYSGTAGSWAGANYFSATGATSVVGTSGATFYITGVQLEKGSTATSFDYRPYGTELALCQRYFQFFGNNGATTGAFGSGYATSTTSVRIMGNGLPTLMRATPTITFSSQTDFAVLCVAGNIASTAVSVLGNSPSCFSLTVTTGASQVAGQGVLLSDNVTGNSKIILSSEL